jgi:MFS family permease
VYRFTLVSFLAASTLCCVAPTMPLLIAARTMQGVGGGLMVSVALSAIGISFPPNLRSRAFAANSTIWGLMSFSGPALAAALLKTPLGWRAVFAVNLPLTTFAAVIGWSRLPGPTPMEQGSHRPRLDVRGLVFVSIFAAAILLGASELNRWTVPALVVAAVAGIAAWRRAGGSKDPVMAQRYLNRAPIAAINWAVFTIFAGGLAVETFVPLFVRGGLGHSDQAGAFSVSFMSLGWTCASITVARLLDRITEDVAMVYGFLLAALPLVIGLAVYGPGTPLWLVAGNSFLQGAGIGAATNAGMTLLQKATPMDEMGRANAAHQFVRNLGSTIGVSLVGGVLFGYVRHRLGSLDEIQPLLKGEKQAEVSQAARRALAMGYRWSHILAVTLIAVGLVITFRLRAYVRANGDA